MPAGIRWSRHGSQGVFKKIEEITNVKLDITYDSGDYNQNIGLDINAGNAAYIIPKVCEEGQYVDGGAVVASDYTQYMPNYGFCRNLSNAA